VHIDYSALVAATGASAIVFFFVSQVGVILAYRGYYLRRFETPCALPLFRLGRTGPTVLDNIRHLEFRDPLGRTLRSWLILDYLAQLVLALSLAGFLISVVASL